MQSQLLTLWPVNTNSLAQCGSILLNTLELAHTAFQSIASLLGSAPHQAMGYLSKEESLRHMFCAHRDAYNCGVTMTGFLDAAVDRCSPGQQQLPACVRQLLASPHLLPCAAIVSMAAALAAAPFPQRAGGVALDRQHHSSSNQGDPSKASSSSMSSNSSTNIQTSHCSWKLAKKQARKHLPA